MDAFEVLVQQLDEKAQQLQEAVSTGREETFEEYKKTCGEIRGLTNVEMYLLDLAKNLEHFDDE